MDLSLPEEVQIIFMLMVEDGLDITCSNLMLPRYWSVNWDHCPLCGEGFETGQLIHKYRQ